MFVSVLILSFLSLSCGKDGTEKKNNSLKSKIIETARFKKSNDNTSEEKYDEAFISKNYQEFSNQIFEKTTVENSNYLINDIKTIKSQITLTNYESVLNKIQKAISGNEIIFSANDNEIFVKILFYYKNAKSDIKDNIKNVLSFLLKKEIFDPNKTYSGDSQYNTLILACLNKDYLIASLVFPYIKDINQQGSDGNTALMALFKAPKKVITREEEDNVKNIYNLLMKNGNINIELKNKLGETIEDIMDKYQEIVEKNFIN
jgi:hypothetical protein